MEEALCNHEHEPQELLSSKPGPTKTKAVMAFLECGDIFCIQKDCLHYFGDAEDYYYSSKVGTAMINHYQHKHKAEITANADPLTKCNHCGLVMDALTLHLHDYPHYMALTIEDELLSTNLKRLSNRYNAYTPAVIIADQLNCSSRTAD